MSRQTMKTAFSGGLPPRFKAFILLLALFGTVAAPASVSAQVAPMIDALHNANPQTRWQAADELGRMGPQAGSAIPALIQAMADPERRVNKSAMMALHNIGPAAIPPLIQALKHNEASVREGAALALSRFGSKAAPAAPALVANLTDSDANARTAAEYALRRIGNPSIPALKTAVNQGDPNLKNEALKVLEKMGLAAN